MPPIRRPASPARPRGASPLALVLAAAAVLAGCATRSADVTPKPTDPAAYAGWRCERVMEEIDRVQSRAADVAYAVDARVGNNLIALGVGVAVFWPALLAMRPDGEEAAELATLKGRYEALRTVAERQDCANAAPRQAEGLGGALPLAVGERLVYEQRSGGDRATLHRLGMRLVAAQRDALEFTLDLDGRVLPGRWRQDASGNHELDGRAAQIGWRRLLRPQLQLGQVIAGELAAAGETQPGARVRGQVVAVGPKELDGRSFDVAVIELFGDAPASGGSRELDGGGSTRIEGVMAVDRRNGLLLRLELRSGNPEFMLTRRLMRVESAGG